MLYCRTTPPYSSQPWQLLKHYSVHYKLHKGHMVSLLSTCQLAVHALVIKNWLSANILSCILFLYGVIVVLHNMRGPIFPFGNTIMVKFNLQATNRFVPTLLSITKIHHWGIGVIATMMSGSSDREAFPMGPPPLWRYYSPLYEYRVFPANCSDAWVFSSLQAWREEACREASRIVRSGNFERKDDWAKCQRLFGPEHWTNCMWYYLLKKWDWVYAETIFAYDDEQILATMDFHHRTTFFQDLPKQLGTSWHLHRTPTEIHANVQISCQQGRVCLTFWWIPICYPRYLN
jgi:hypothetical protein